MTWPLVHFALIGLGLFIGVRLLAPSEQTAETEATKGALDSRIVVSQSQVASLVSQYETTSGTAATNEVRTELIGRFAEEEMLYRESLRWGLAENNEAIDLRLRQKMAFVLDEEHSDEELEAQARALGMGSDDAVIRNMLVHNMRLLLSQKGEVEPTDDEIETFYASERSRFARPARLTGWHVFFSKDRRQSSAMAAARAAKATLNAEAMKPREAAALGDVFPSGAHFKGQLVRQLASRFGEDFARIAERVPVDLWSDPIDTPFGVHLVLVQERTQPESPPLAEIRIRVTAAYKSNQRRKRLAAALEELRAHYVVVVE